MQLVSRRRLVTLVGPPGVGKTRLAVRVAAGQVEHFENGVWLIELARVEERGLVGGAVIDALGLRREHQLKNSPLRISLATTAASWCSTTVNICSRRRLDSLIDSLAVAHG